MHYQALLARKLTTLVRILRKAGANLRSDGRGASSLEKGVCRRKAAFDITF